MGSAPASPPISGGTLLVLQDDQTAVAADPDRDAVWLVDLGSRTVRARVRLDAGAEPGRLIEDQDGMVHVALRRGGQVVKIDPRDGAVLSARAVCPAPRGMAYDAATDNLHVACAGGELVTMKARGGDILRSWQLERDLRDVVVHGDHLLVSRFRSAQLLEVDASGALLGQVKPRAVTGGGLVNAQGQPITASATTAWRLTTLPTGEVLMLHQQAVDSTISTKPGGYTSGTCKGQGIVSPAMTLFSGATAGLASVGNGARLAGLPLAVDLAVARDGKSIALIAPGDRGVAGARFASVAQLNLSALGPADPCQFPTSVPTQLPEGGDLIAGAFDGKGQLWLQSRNPARLYSTASGLAPIDFPDAEDKSDEGHRLFHTPTPGLIACVSCHAEAGDDGHVWTFDAAPSGPRRTQSLRGGILATAPFHWDGDMQDLSHLMQAVFTGRMAGPLASPEQVDALGLWLDAQPVLPKASPRDPQAVARGRILFNDAAVGCASCHSGTHFTNNQSVGVGTGKSLQVPALLGVADREPFLHTGCAGTLLARFDPACGGGESHGHTAQLAPAQLADLIAYLESL
ncbi:MAG TPA: cytochrome-c peroxidase [Pseudomonadota bacterium]|nr:cytochrome-c peroxidase [Pseudomonadota bacterium]